MSAEDEDQKSSGGESSSLGAGPRGAAGDSAKKPHNINIQGLAGELLKRAVTLGAGAYVSAEESVSKTLNSVQAPIHISKAVLNDLVDKFVENYSMQITAKIDFVKKNKKKESEENV